MNKIEFVKDKIPFTQVANGVLTDNRLSAKAKGLYAYLYSKPDGWDFAVQRIALEMSDGEYSIQEGLHELERLGFLTRKRQADGRVVYKVHFPPLQPNRKNYEMEKPNRENPKQGKSQTGKIAVINNKERENNKEALKNKYIATNVADWDLEKALLKMEEKDNSHLDIIATFIREKPVKIENAKQLTAVIKRFAKVASQMSGAYTTKQIFNAVEKIKERNKIEEKKGGMVVDYTLETVLKQLTK